MEQTYIIEKYLVRFHTEPLNAKGEIHAQMFITQMSCRSIHTTNFNIP